MSLEGVLTPGLAATLGYTDGRGRRLTCRNSKLSTLRLRLWEGGREEHLDTQAAAMEYAEPAS